MDKKYKNSLLKICDYLIMDTKKCEYVLNCYGQQEEHDMEEMSRAEMHSGVKEKLTARMEAKKEQVAVIKNQLSNMKNVEFKNLTAEFLQWCMLQSDPPKLYTQIYPSTLKSNLAEIKRYDNDLVMMASDVNRKFKFISTSTTSPES